MVATMHKPNRANTGQLQDTIYGNPPLSQGIGKLLLVVLRSCAHYLDEPATNSTEIPTHGRIAHQLSQVFILESTWLLRL